MTETSNSQILARGSLRIRILTVLVPKNFPLVFRPHTPVINGVLIDRAMSFAQEAYADGARRCGARVREPIGGSKNRGGELYEKNEGGRKSLHYP